MAQATATPDRALTPAAIRAQRRTIEDLICQAMRQLEDLGGNVWDAPDGEMDKHNAMVAAMWEGLDRLALWAGGAPMYRYMDGDEEAQRRGAFVRACLALYAEVEQDAEVAEVEVTALTADGATVSYYTAPTGPSPFGGWAWRWPLVGRTVHTDDHTGCADLPPDPAPHPPDPLD
jgi:hypothetical protein